MSAVAASQDIQSLQDRILALEEEVSALRQHLEKIELQVSLRRGIEEADRGLGTPATEVAERLRNKYNLPR